MNLAGVDPEQIIVPTSLEQLVQIVASAQRQQRRVRMTGSGHSFSDVAINDECLLRPQGLTLPLKLDRRQLADHVEAREELVRVESGITLRDLNPWLWNVEGLALSNLGGYDAQTIVGAAITGTHGSGLTHGPIASQIQSLQVVSVDGEVLQIEPADGITDARRFPGHIETRAGRVAARLVQDDHLFRAVTVSMGCMGIVYSVVLRAEHQYWLAEHRVPTTWGALTRSDGFLDRLIRDRKLDDGDAPDPEYYEIYVNPYPSRPNDPIEQRRCLLTKRYKRRVPPVRLTREETTRGKVQDWQLKLVNSLTGHGGSIASFLNDNPDKAGWVIDQSLDAIEDKGGFVDRSYQVFHLGEANHVRAYGIEMAFDVKQSVEAIERLFMHAEELRARGFVHSSPPSLRFVKSSDAWLAMQHGRPTMMLEMGVLVCANGSDELLESYEHMYMRLMQARPHWGLDLNVITSFEQVRQLYGSAADQWLAAYRKLNPHGTFSGRFTDRLGLDAL